jgi:hypothetical protein
VRQGVTKKGFFYRKPKARALAVRRCFAFHFTYD